MMTYTLKVSYQTKKHPALRGVLSAEFQLFLGFALVFQKFYLNGLGGAAAGINLHGNCVARLMRVQGGIQVIERSDFLSARFRDDVADLRLSVHVTVGVNPADFHSLRSTEEAGL